MSVRFQANKDLTYDVREWPTAHGVYEPGSEYVRRFWTCVLGPTARLMWEQLAESIGRDQVELAELYQEIGIRQTGVMRNNLDRLYLKRLISHRDGQLIVVPRLGRLRDVDRDALPWRLLTLHAQVHAEEAS